jgi:hypothetical protein
MNFQPRNDYSVIMRLVGHCSVGGARFMSVAIRPLKPALLDPINQTS